MVTVAFGTTAPVESVTVPVTLPALPVDCEEPTAPSSSSTIPMVDRHCNQPVVRSFTCSAEPVKPSPKNAFAVSCNGKLPDMSTSKSCCRLPSHRKYEE